MNELTIMQKFADLELMHSLTLGEKTLGALITTVMGMGITFSILVLLWGLIALMAKLTSSKPKTPKGSPEQGTAKTAPAAAPMVMQASTTVESSSELIAVLMAAIEVFEGKTADAGNLIIRRISRVAGQTTAWGNAGTSEAIGNRKF